MRVLQTVAAIVLVAVCGYVLMLVLVFAGCSTSGSGTGDIRPAESTER